MLFENNFHFRPYAYRQTKTGLNAIYMYSKTVDILVVITLTKGNNPAEAPTINYGHDGLMFTAFFIPANRLEDGLALFTSRFLSLA